MPSRSQRILVTGSEGYIGSVLMPLLQRAGHAPLGLDVGWFAEGKLIGGDASWRFVRKDVRDVEPSDVEGHDAVVHLAALSNDPLGEIDPGLTLDINYRATVRLAEVAREVGVKRFIFSSSCSMYGRAGEVPLDEAATFSPQTVYAESKVAAETELRSLATDSFSPVFLRNATAYGISPRQRFDLVLPNLAGWAHTAGEIRLTSDGTPWRPLVHVRDICNAVLAALEAPVDAIHNEAFNIGVNSENYQVREIASAVNAAFPESRLSFGPTSREPDTRSYRVDFSKAAAHLPGFSPEWTLAQGVAECVTAFKAVGLDRTTFEHRFYTRLRQISYLLENKLLDQHLYPMTSRGEFAVEQSASNTGEQLRT